jgi:pSer/pThr/pTyr-binding forkhead associated (FHA) protein
MTDGLPQAAARATGRASAARAAKGLLDKGRPKDAVALLAAWAANGANDVEGQSLLAEALRIDPGSRLAKLAFERMEGIKGEHAELEAAIAEWSPQVVERIEQEIARPAFRRAQVGFNNNVKYKNQTFHIQTEDSGLDKPHVITHLFADGGRVIKSHKRLYTEHVAREDVAAVVRQLMKGQQLEMALALRDGKFDRIIEGKAIGGMELLEHPPKVDVQKLATQKKTRVTAAADGAEEAPASAAALRSALRTTAEDQRAHFRLVVTRSLGGGGPDVYEPKGVAAIIGAAGTIRLPGERFCHPREAEVRVRDGRLWLSDFETGNGVFVRTRAAVELSLGDEFVVGDQLLRVDRNPASQDGPGPGPTYFYSSPKWPSSFRVVQIFEGGALGASVLAHGTTLQIGSSQGDFVFPSDPLVSDQHCFIEETAGTILLTELGSRTGVFVRIKGEQELVNGDELLVGRTRLSVERIP